MEEKLGIQIGIPDTEKLLKLLVDKQGREKLYGYMYQLSGYERNLRKKGVFKELDKLKDRFEKGSGYISKVGDMLDFVALFDPSNVDPDSPISSLKAIGNVIGAMKDLTEAIPAIGSLLDFYIDATEQFTQALEELNTKILNARDGSICGQLGVLSAELKALDEHIKGGACINFYTNYELQSLLKPVLVWTHAESNETFFYDKDHDVAAYLTSDNQPDLLDPFRALKSSRIASNSKRATPAVFMALARVVTRSKAVVAKPECDDYARLFSDRNFRAILREVNVLDNFDAISAPSGTVLKPAITSPAEITGLCLYDPRMRRLMRDLADRYRHLASVTIDVYPLDRELSPDVTDIRIDGMPLVFGEAGAKKRRVSEYTRIEALVDIRHPLSVEVDAVGFKPALESLSFSAERRFKTIYMAREEAVQAVPEADADAKPDADGGEDAVGMADADGDQRSVEGEPAAKQIAPVAVDKPQPVSPRPVPQEPQQSSAQQATAQDAPAQPAQAAEPAKPAGDVPGAETVGNDTAAAAGTETDADAGTDDAGDVDAPPVSAKPDPAESDTDQAPASADAPEQTSMDQTDDGLADEAGEDVAGAGNEAAPSAPGSDNIVSLTIARGQVYLGETIQISTPYRGEDIAGGTDECDPNSTNPFTGCEVTPSGSNGASVYIGRADDTEDLGPARPLPSLDYIWHGSEGVTFEPTTSSDGRTFATFERVGEMKIWAQVVKQGATIAETEQQTVNVLAPSLSIKFDPASGAKAGSKIKATVVATPLVSPKYWTVRWLEPPTANREELNDNGSEIRFSGAAGKSVTLEATANVAFYGDEIGSVSGSYSLEAGSLDVSARSRGPRPQIWDRASGGLVDLPDGQYVDGQEIDLRAGFAGDDTPGEVRWRWSVNEGTSISNEISQTPTVSRAQAGQIEARVIATDKNGVELASGSISLSVQAQGQPPADKSGSTTSKPAPVPDAADVSDSQPLTQKQKPARPMPAPGIPAPVAKQPITAAPAPASPTTPPPPAESASPPPSSPLPPQPTPPPAAAVCAIGSPQYTAAVELWTRGLSMISAGNAEVGLGSLEASLVVCPDPTRQSQFTALRQQLGGAGAQTSQPPLPAADCSSGGRDYAEAMSNWQQGLSLLGAGDHKAGVVALERSLDTCPDPQRQSQLDRLKTQLEAAAAEQSGEAGACLPGGDRYASAQDAWRRGIALIGSGESGAGVALLEMSVGDCPDDTRRSQLEALRQQLNISEESGDEVAGDASEQGASTSIEDAVKQAAKACEPGGSRYAEAEASWIRGSDLLGAGDRTGGLEALRRSVSICADPDRVANLEQVSVLIEEAIVREQQAQADAQRQAEEAARQAADAERTAQQAPQPAEPKSMEAPSTPQPTRYSGSVEGAPLCRLSFEFSNGQVNGQITGTYEGDQINLTFRGNADGNQFGVPLSGYLIDSSGHFGRVSITGTVRGAFANGFFTGSWTAGNDYQTDGGRWIAGPE